MGDFYYRPDDEAGYKNQQWRHGVVTARVLVAASGVGCIPKKNNKGDGNENCIQSNIRLRRHGDDSAEADALGLTLNLRF